MTDRDACISFFHRVQKRRDVFCVPKQNQRDEKKDEENSIDLTHRNDSFVDIFHF